MADSFMKNKGEYPLLLILVLVMSSVYIISVLVMI